MFRVKRCADVFVFVGVSSGFGFISSGDLVGAGLLRRRAHDPERLGRRLDGLDTCQDLFVARPAGLVSSGEELVRRDLVGILSGSGSVLGSLLGSISGSNFA